MTDFITIRPEGAALSADPPARLPDSGFVWCDCRHDEPRSWPEVVRELTGIEVFEAHLLDAESPNHPSYFDSTADYEMIVFRGLAARADQPDEPRGRMLRTRPAVFFVMPGLLVTVRAADSRSFAAARERLFGARAAATRMPPSPEELMLRILNAMVDRYLELRQPLTEALERLQRELLDPRRPFRDWYPLLEARREAMRLQDLCEEQLDAIQEWRDERLERSSDSAAEAGADVSSTGGAANRGCASREANTAGLPRRALAALSDSLQVRVNDLVEHINRVLNHARRMESSLETAVQLHFSATAHRTNEIMRTLTAITAVFLPLTLITGVFGMNFEFIPGLHSPSGFWWAIAAMLVIGIAMLAHFRARAFLHESALFGSRRRERGRLKRNDAGSRR